MVHSLDPCFFKHFAEGLCICLLGVHVDDVIIAAGRSARGTAIRDNVINSGE